MIYIQNNSIPQFIHNIVHQIKVHRFLNVDRPAGITSSPSTEDNQDGPARITGSPSTESNQDGPSTITP